MEIDDWWSRLAPESREWLMDNNGDAVRGDIVAEIAQLGGTTASDAWWVGEDGPNGFFLSDRAIDWVEAKANGEEPGAG